ncbi:hypothetical protein L873DRAFT_1849035 [Choiromyces venosus 120613-1]|uniref:Uncharacterized protein n=1 Tax=Choiromyces venosus 120613-1 TaxID=1336337 RepID=A0A3N4J7Z2_9PEZI|nr:hypothetical protein L873DRAFT_1849035 [Choiromyces venosus 120613-1]
MPEGLTYWDMARMLKAQIPAAMGLSINRGFWLRWQFALYRHTVAMPLEEYESYKKAWLTTSKDNVAIQLAVVGSEMCIAFVDKNKLVQIACIPLYPTISHPNSFTILLLPLLLPIKTTTKTWYDASLAPYPIMDITTFKENLLHSQNQQALRHQRKSNAIYFEIAGSKNNCLWNGIGTSHAVEILHLALIHPEKKTYNVFRSQELKERLVQAIEDFFVQAHSPDYQQRIPANKTPTRAFEFAKSTTQYYHSQVTKVYRKKDTLISYTQYQTLWEAGQLDKQICDPLSQGWEENLMMETGRERKKRVLVYILEFKTGIVVSRYVTLQEELKEVDDYIVTESEDGSGGDRGGAGQKRKKKEKQKGRRRFLDPETERTDIGPVIFNDTVKEGKDREVEVNKFCKRLPVRTGKVGWPVVRKKSRQEM